MDQLARVAGVVDDALGTNVVGTYLHGSAVDGGLKPASDLDVLVVCRESLDEEQRQVLLDGLLTISGRRAGGRPVELTVVVESEVRPWRFPPVGDFLYGEWLRHELESSGPPRPEPMPDLAVVIAQALAGDHSLDGPPPAEVLDPVPAEDIARASAAGIPGLLEDLAGDTRNVVLTLARIWTTLATGEIRSKDAAADWALPRLRPEHRPVLAHARDLYLNRTYAEEIWSDGLRLQVGAHVQAVLAEIESLDKRR